MSKYDFSVVQRVIKKYHNLQINREIKKKDLKTSRKNIYKKLLIENTDTAQLIILKMLFFWVSNGNLNRLIDGEAIATIPEDYVIKPGDNIPQLVIIFRVKGSKGHNYPIYIPHYNGNKTPRINNYKKGSFGVTLTLKDNTKMTIHANSYKSAEAYIKKNLLIYVDPKYKTDNFKNLRRKVKNQEMTPVRADYYPEGKAKGIRPLWRHYFS